MKISKETFIKNYQKKQKGIIAKSCILTMIIYFIYSWEPFLELLNVSPIRIEELGTYFFSVVLAFSLITHPIIAILDSFREKNDFPNPKSGIEVLSKDVK